MSKTNRMNTSYLFCATAETQIGFDGMGAIDKEASDLLLKSTDPLFGISNFEAFQAELILQDAKKTPEIILRNGVKEFDFLWEHKYGFCLFSEAAYERFKGDFDTTFCSVTPVRCIGETKSFLRLFGKFKHRRILKENVDWANTEFGTIANDKFSFRFTYIERGSLDYRSELELQTKGIKFSSISEYLGFTKKNLLKTLVPTSLSLNLPNAPVMLFMQINLCLVRKDFADFLIGRDQSGLILSMPELPVFYG